MRAGGSHHPGKKPYVVIFLRKGEKGAFPGLQRGAALGVAGKLGKSLRGKALGAPWEWRGGEKFSLLIKMVTIKGFFQAVFWLGEVTRGYP